MTRKTYPTPAQTPEEIEFRGLIYRRTEIYQAAGGWDQSQLEEAARLEAEYARRDGVRACVKSYRTLQWGRVWVVYEGPEMGA